MNFYLCPRCQFRIPSNKYLCSTCGLKITPVHETHDAIQESPDVIAVKSTFLNKLFNLGRHHNKVVETTAEKPALS
jgi:predicted amidophosphoribosyltransferase